MTSSTGPMTMHAVVFEVDMKEGWESTAEVELDTSSTTDGSIGLSLIVFESGEVAQEVADNAGLPPEAGATLRSARVLEVLREA